MLFSILLVVQIDKKN